jgi:hypothetical protein
MPLTQLDPKPALIVIDLQKGIVTLPTTHPSPDITARSSALVRAFRTHGLPVILVNVAGGAPGRADVSHAFNPPADWTELVSELERQPGDHVVTKHPWGAFPEARLHHYLQAQASHSLFFAGSPPAPALNRRPGMPTSTAITWYWSRSMTDLDAKPRQQCKRIFPGSERSARLPNFWPGSGRHDNRGGKARRRGRAEGGRNPAAE